MRYLQKQNLIHLLIQYSKSQSDEARAYCLMQVNQQAISLFENAFQEAGRDFSDIAHYFDKEKWAVKKQVINEFEQAKLTDETQFNAMASAINAWQVSKSHPNYRQCQKVRQILGAIVPKIIQKQKLLKICGDYRAHLQEVIQTESEIDYSKNMEQFIDDHSQTIANDSESLDSAIKKYIAIHSMYKTLVTPSRVETQIMHFKHEFFLNRSIIEKDRDSQAMKCIKKIATVLSFGIAHVLGIWNVKGKIAADNVQTVLNTPTCFSFDQYPQKEVIIYETFKNFM